MLSYKEIMNYESASGNPGFVYTTFKNYCMGISLLKNDYSLSIKNKEWPIAENLLCTLEEINLKR